MQVGLPIQISIIGCIEITVHIQSCVDYITPDLLSSMKTRTTQKMLIIMPIGPLLILDDGLNPRIGSAFSAKSYSISPIDFISLRTSLGFMMISRNDALELLVECSQIIFL